MLRLFGAGRARGLKSSHGILLALAVSAIVPASGEGVQAKTPGARYCFNRVCHTVRTIEETKASIGRTELVVASFYDDAARDRFNPRNLTSSGEMFAPGRADNAASPVYPDGTTLLVWNPATRQAAVVRINNAGPYYGRRKLDLSRAAAEKLGVSGVADVAVRVLSAPTLADATYARGRKYPPVPGFLGAYASLDQAHSGAAIALNEPLSSRSIEVAALTHNSPAILPEGAAVVLPPETGVEAASATVTTLAQLPTEMTPDTSEATYIMAALKPDRASPVYELPPQEALAYPRARISPPRGPAATTEKTKAAKAGMVRLAAIVPAPARAMAKPGKSPKAALHRRPVDAVEEDAPADEGIAEAVLRGVN